MLKLLEDRLEPDIIHKKQQKFLSSEEQLIVHN